MPNWCSNEVVVTGPEEHIREFLSSISNEGKDPQWSILENLYPPPGGEWNYSWCIDNWGSKWGDCHTFVTIYPNGTLLLSFDSAWGPCIEGFDYIAEEFPELGFSYIFWEMGMMFEGRYAWKKGRRYAQIDRDVRWEDYGTEDDWFENYEPPEHWDVEAL